MNIGVVECFRGCRAWLDGLGGGLSCIGMVMQDARMDTSNMRPRIDLTRVLGSFKDWFYMSRGPSEVLTIHKAYWSYSYRCGSMLCHVLIS